MAINDFIISTLNVSDDMIFVSSLNKNDTTSLNDFDTFDMCIIYIPSMINIGGVLL